MMKSEEQLLEMLAVIQLLPPFQSPEFQGIKVISPYRL
jgi:hypothetical protein